jgi:ABC-type multidrug transport system ATPase subunit
LLFGASPGEHLKDVKGHVSLPKKVAYISQHGFLPTDTSVKGFFEESTDESKLKELFKHAHLESILEQKDCSKLSGGQKKRLMLIEAILKEPELLVLDEAFTGLDTESTLIMKEMIKTNLPNAIVISVMHAAPDRFYTHKLEFDKKDNQTSVVFSQLHFPRQRSNSIC